MHQLRPEAQFIAMSGMIQPAAFAKISSNGIRIEVLNKPFAVQEIFATFTRLQR